MKPFSDASDLAYFRTAICNGTLLPNNSFASAPRSFQPKTPDPPTTSIVYAHDSEAGCIYSSSLRTLIVTKFAAKVLLKSKFARLAQLRTDFEAHADQRTNSSHAELLAAVKMGYLGTAVYLRRCNGQFVNAVGEVMTVEGAEALNRTENSITKKLWKSEDEDRSRESLDEMDSTAESNQPVSKANGSGASISSGLGVELGTDGHLQMEPKMALSVLEARERLVREGQVSEEDFIITCWAMNKRSPNTADSRANETDVEVRKPATHRLLSQRTSLAHGSC